MIIVIISYDNRNHHPFKMSDEVQTASQGCHRIAAAFYYKSKSRGEQDTRETEMLILKVKGTAHSRFMKPNQYRHLFLI